MTIPELVRTKLVKSTNYEESISTLRKIFFIEVSDEKKLRIVEEFSWNIIIQ
jgi:Rps23 Pro-64 3,4-dihydroxylase Tpa1-like proline 4-hydroxylase